MQTVPQNGQRLKTPNLAENRALRLATLCMLYVSQGITFGFTSTAVKNYLNARQVSLAETGAILSYISLPFALKFLWGPVMDRWGYQPMGRRRPWILIAQGGAVIGLTIFAFMPGMDTVSPAMLTTLALMTLMTNLFASMQDVAVDALAIDLLPEKERGTVSALMYGGSYFGTFFGGWFVGMVLTKFGFREAFLVQAGLLALIMLLPMFLRERRGEKLFPWTEGKPMAPESASSAASFQQLLGWIVRAFSNFRALAFGVFAALVYLGGTALTTIRSHYFINHGGWSEKDYNALESVWGVWFGLAGCLVGAVAGRIDARLRVAVSSVVLGGLWCWFAASDLEIFREKGVLTAFALSAEFVKAFMAVSMFAMFMAIADKRVSATQFTAYMALLNLSTGAAQRWAGSISDWFGIQGAHVAMAGFQVAILALLLVGKPRQTSDL
ncbi:MAG: PAT family beta-lactamase induction signal transducer AmpG [Verrucomicrobiales bacterium]